MSFLDSFPHWLTGLGQHNALRRSPFLFQHAAQTVQGVCQAFPELFKDDPTELVLLETLDGEMLMMNSSAWEFVMALEGGGSLRSAYRRLKHPQRPVFYSALKTASHESPVGELLPPDLRNRHAATRIGDFSRQELSGDFLGYMELATVLEQHGFVAVPAGTFLSPIGTPPEIQPRRDRIQTAGAPKRSARVLLLGATTGSATTGIMYIASYLRRHGVEAWCQTNDVWDSRAQLSSHLNYLLDAMRPGIVGISLKWFPHIARTLEMCRIIKSVSPDVSTVLGGDTASYFYRELMEFDCVDYVVRGDGEVPMLELARGNPEQENVITKSRAENPPPISFVNTNENGDSSYLSHLSDIFMSPIELMQMPYVYVSTGRGCPLNCFYCAAARENQFPVFGRRKPLFRGIEEIRSDIQQLLPYTSTLMWDFDVPKAGSFETYTSAWTGLELGNHFSRFLTWVLPETEFVEFMSKTFKFVDLSIDLASLSERHRLYLTELRGPRGGTIAKPQPSDAELLKFFETCDRIDNLRVSISTIAGMPFYTDDDMTASEQMVERLTTRHRSFHTIEWGRLHIQPGSPLEKDYDFYGFAKPATTFGEYLAASQKNMERDPYPDIATVSYSFLHPKDRSAVSKMYKHYSRVSRILRDARGGP